ncbi:MAG: hypothetical protein J6C52_04355 [Clostridia bacterium]|nr:hypothetical protein [Clostridia bacterium]
MKLTRILTLALAFVMLALCAVSCGEPKIKVNVTVKIIADNPDEPILDTPITIESTNPTVLEAVREALFVNEIPYNLTDDQSSILDIQDYKDLAANQSGDGLVYYWMYYLNDVEPTTGKAVDNAIAEGDVITYVYSSFDPTQIK